MRRTLLLFLYIFATTNLIGQTSTANYVMEKTFLNESGTTCIRSVQYYDGLGRPSVSAAGGIAGDGKYVYTMQEYDRNGREAIHWLPAVGGTSPVLVDTVTFRTLSSATYDDAYAFSTTHYDALSRPVFISTPGEEWFGADKGNVVGYVTNTASDQIKKYRQRSATVLVTNGQTFAPGTLTGEVREDEDGLRTVIYRDMLGRVILERRDDSNDTYFVYNAGGQLRFVLSPNYQDGASQYNRYEYRYDGKGRCTRKILPNSIYTDYWYDSGNRVKLMQDGLLRAASRYRFFLYDSLNRLVVQGTCTGANTDESALALTISFNAGSSLLGTGYVADASLAFIDPQLEVVNYYDGYACLTAPLFLSAAGSHSFSRTDPACAQGLLTGGISVAGNGEVLCFACYYDEKGQVVDVRQTQLAGGFMQTATSYSFTGKPLSVAETLAKGGTSVSCTRAYTYDTSTDQLSQETLTYNNQPAQTATYTYDDLGRVSTKYSQSGDLGTSYTYDLHGWLTGISSFNYVTHSNLFTESLAYASGPHACYDGNISSLTYRTADNQSHGYRFQYDGLNRLTSAVHCLADLTEQPQLYSETGIEYDLNGNVVRLTRTGLSSLGAGSIDRMQYLTYTANQLKAVRDSAGSNVLYAGGFEFRQVDGFKTTQYTYDGNGSLTTDRNKGIAKMEYDLLGHPRRVQFRDGHVIEYVYAPDGTKLRTVWRTAVSGISVAYGQTHELTAAETLFRDSTDYAGRFLLKGSAMDRYLFDGGYLTAGTIPKLHYYLQDHQGSNRVVVGTMDMSTHSWLTTEQVTHYYPFGGLWGDLSTNQGVQPYKFGDKELDRMYGYDLYDFGARNYDPAIARFTGMDPLAEQYYHLSPYAYCANNPVNYIDPDGRSPIYDPEGNFLGTDNLGLIGKYYVLERDKFTQGMSPADVAWNAIKDELSDEVQQKITTHYNSLKSRPDYDGFVTIKEGIAWAKKHPHALENPTPDNMLYIDASKLDFGNISISGVDKRNGNINMYNDDNFIRSIVNHRLASSVYALGRVQLKIMDYKAKHVKIDNDYNKEEGRATDYDWNSGGGWRRSLAISLEKKRARIADGLGFRVYYYGYGTLNR